MGLFIKASGTCAVFCSSTVNVCIVYLISPTFLLLRLGCLCHCLPTVNNPPVCPIMQFVVSVFAPLGENWCESSLTLRIFCPKIAIFSQFSKGYFYCEVRAFFLTLLGNFLQRSYYTLCSQIDKVCLYVFQCFKIFWIRFLTRTSNTYRAPS